MLRELGGKENLLTRETVVWLSFGFPLISSLWPATEQLWKSLKQTARHKGDRAFTQVFSAQLSFPLPVLEGDIQKGGEHGCGLNGILGVQGGSPRPLLLCYRGTGGAGTAQHPPASTRRWP